MKEAFSVKLQSENKAQDAQIRNTMQSSSSLIKISGPTLEVKKKSELIKDSQNIFAYWKESEQSEALAIKLGLFQIQLGVLGGSITPANTIVK